MRVYQYPGCSTCKKALRWLKEHGIDVSTVHIVDSPPSQELLASLVDRSGLPLKRFFNTSGQSYRLGGFKERLPGMSRTEQLAALAADGKLIRRPILVSEHVVLVGFKEETYAEALKP